MNKWVQHVKQYRNNHPSLSYREALQEARKSYHSKKEASAFLGQKGKEAHVKQLEKKLKKCEDEKEELKKYGIKKPTTAAKKDINDMLLTEQIQLMLDYEGEREEFLRKIDPKRRAQMRSIIGKAQREAKTIGMVGDYIPVLNRVTGKYEIDPDVSKKQTTGFKNQNEMDQFIHDRTLELALQEQNRPPLNIFAVKLKKRG